ncbi:MAG: methyltransferase domain-containing protein, partial [Rhodococcus sp. (in: high G+C Gram-positive bacteria)]|nr:methyltransferase domain-containing protein [Rhodococcus sp. (in: high G+C Gram-positive bacteria)]MDX5452372.1 methyltransferase domain-containing protein [Rhodococcus sp. (in: high G+C Gram-positive bacteria)]
MSPADDRGIGSSSATRWQSERSADDSRAYIERFAELAHAGTDLHGEARFVDVLVPRGARILDAGCGTGRVGLELARRGHRVTAVDLDPVLVEAARSHPELTVHLADLAQLDLPG